MVMELLFKGIFFKCFGEIYIWIIFLKFKLDMFLCLFLIIKFILFNYKQIKQLLNIS